MSRTPSTLGLALVTLPAAALVAIGGVIAVRPALLFEQVPAFQTLLASVDPGMIVIALVALFVLIAPTLGVSGRLRPASTTSLVEDEGRTRADDQLREQTTQQTVVGATIDDQVTLATAYDDEPRESRETARQELLESLRPIAATAYANCAGCPEEEAMAAIEAGTWTDDPRAGAFLAAADGPSTPLWLWLLDLVSTADPFEQHLERTLDEIETLQSTAMVVEPTANISTDTEGMSS